MKFSSLFSSRVPSELVDCIEDLLRYDPANRATTRDCLKHPYFLKVAPRLQPIKNRAPVAVATPAPQADTAHLGSVDPTAARQALPPSHSNMPGEHRPAFGEGQIPSNLQRIPFYRPQPPGANVSATRQEAADGNAPHFYRAGARDASQYPAFPESASMYSMASQQASRPPENGSSLRPDMPPEHRQAFAPRPSEEYTVGAAANQQPPERKGWGMTFPSVFSNSSTGMHGHAQDPNAGAASNSRGPSLALPRPMQSGAFGSADAGKPPMDTVAPPTDPKKAKKEAEKAAKQAEKAKRLAQEKAARDRARAVMQKRHQILASSENKEQVEWLSNAAPTDWKSEKARGKQPLQSNLSPTHSPRSPSGLSPSEGPGFMVQQQQQPYVSSGYMATSPGMQPRPLFGNAGPYPHIMGEMRDNGRPGSVQSYATGDSDPGPQGTRPRPPHPAMHRQNSASSLSSGLDAFAQDPSHQYHHAGSVESLRSGNDARSISSLDPQLVSNMEAMTAAERHSGSVSPAPAHLVGTRTSVSRQSTRSRSRASSIQRGGSASPLHHTIAPRFHPYGMTGPPPASSHSQSSNHSHFSGFQLPPLQSIEDDRRRVARPPPARRQSSHSAPRPPLSRGSIGSNNAAADPNGFVIHSPASGQLSLQYGGHSIGGSRHGAPGSAGSGVNPMWGTGRDRSASSSAVLTAGAGHHTAQRLPPFSALVAAAGRQEDTEMVVDDRTVDPRNPPRHAFPPNEFRQ